MMFKVHTFYIIEPIQYIVVTEAGLKPLLSTTKLYLAMILGD